MSICLERQKSRILLELKIEVLWGGKRRLSALFTVAQKVWRLQIADINIYVKSNPFEQ